MADINSVEDIVPSERIKAQLEAVTKNAESALAAINRYGAGLEKNLIKGMKQASQPVSNIKKQLKIIDTTLRALDTAVTTFEQKQQMAQTAQLQRLERTGTAYGDQATRIRRAMRMIADAQQVLVTNNVQLDRSLTKNGANSATLFMRYQRGLTALQKRMIKTDQLTGRAAETARRGIEVRVANLAKLQIAYEQVAASEKRQAAVEAKAARDRARADNERARAQRVAYRQQAGLEASAASGDRMRALRGERTAVQAQYRTARGNGQTPAELTQYLTRLREIEVAIRQISSARKAEQVATATANREARKAAALQEASLRRLARAEAMGAGGTRTALLRGERTRLQGDYRAARVAHEAPAVLNRYLEQLRAIELELQRIAEARRVDARAAQAARKAEREAALAARAETSRTARSEAVSASGDQLASLRGERTRLRGAYVAASVKGASPQALAEYTRQLHEVEAAIKRVTQAQRVNQQVAVKAQVAQTLRTQAALTTDLIEKNQLLARAVRTERDAAIRSGQGTTASLKAQQEEYERLLLKVQQLKAEQAARGAKPGVTLGQRFTNQARILANYALMGAGVGAVAGIGRQLLGFDEALRNMQAITKSTDAAVASLSADILQLASNSKFSAVELANASTILGQAGLSAEQAGQALKGVVALAQGAGATLQQSVDLITSAMGAFKLRASESVDIANTFTAALNGSKLQMQQLGTAFQYAAAPAAQLGMSYQELTAIMMGMAQAGVRSGSIIGTGIRQVLNQLTAMRPKLATILHDLKIAPEEVDVSARGLIPVLQTLQKKGFGVAEAFKAFGTRGAGAFAIMANQAGHLESFEQSIINTTAATDAANTQMRSLVNTGRMFGNVLVAAANDGLAPLMQGLQDLLHVGAHAAQVFTKLGAAGRILATALALGLGVKLMGYVRNLLTFNATAAEAEAGALGLRAAMVGLTTGTVTAGAAMKSLIASINPVALAVVGLSTAIELYEGHAARAAQNQQQLASAVDSAQGVFTAAKTSYDAASEAVQRLLDRQKELKNSAPEFQLEATRLQERFGDLGLSIDDLGGSYDRLLTKMRAVQAEAEATTRAALSDLLAKNMTLNGAYLQKLEALRGNYMSTSTYNQGTNAPVAPHSALGLGINRLAASRNRAFSTADLPVLRAARLELSRRQQSGPLPNDFLKATSDRLTKVIDLLSKLQRGDALVKRLQTREAGFDWADTPAGKKMVSALESFTARTKSTNKADASVSLLQAAGNPKQIVQVSQNIQNWIKQFRKKVAVLPQAAQDYLAPRLNVLAAQGGKALISSTEAGASTTQGTATSAQYDLRSLSAQKANLAWTAKNGATLAVRQAARQQVSALFDRELRDQIDKMKGSKAFSALSPEAQTGAIGSVTQQITQQKTLLLKQIDSSISSFTLKAVKASAKAALSAIARDLTTIDAGGHKSTYREARAALDDAQAMLNKWEQAKVTALGANPSQDQLDAISAQKAVLQGRISAKRTTLQGRSVDNWDDFWAQRRERVQQTGSGPSGDSLSAGMFDSLGAAADSLQQGLGTVLDDMLTKTTSLGDEFKKLGNTVIMSAVKVLENKAVHQLMALLFGEPAANSTQTGGISQTAATGGTATATAAVASPSIWDSLFGTTTTSTGAGTVSGGGGLQIGGGVKTGMETASGPSQSSGLFGAIASGVKSWFRPSQSSPVGSAASNGIGVVSGDAEGTASQIAASGSLGDIVKASQGDATLSSVGNTMASGVGSIAGQGISKAIGGTKGKLIGSILGGMLSAFGGMTFAQGGSVPGTTIDGPIKTRDSVLMPVQSGGFVLRKSAAQHFAQGGTVLAKVMPGERYFNPDEVQAIGLQNLRRLNMGLANGGTVGTAVDTGSMSTAGTMAVSSTKAAGSKVPGSKQTTNVWVVSPDQQPQMGPNDVIATISSDISAGGQVRQMIKQVVQEN